MSADHAKNPFPWHRWAPLLLLVVGAATFANSIENPFIFDDRDPIEESEHIKRLWPLTAPNQSAPAGRPVIILSLAINYAIGGLDPRGYHIFNIAAHVLGSMALFGVIRRTLEGEGLRERFGRAAGAIAMACSLVWLLHPIQTEVINYVVQRTSSMMSLFYLVAFYCAIRAAGASRPGRWYAFAGVAAVMGMMCKESMATVLPLLVLYDVAFLPGGIRAVLRRRWPLYACFVPAYVVLGIIMSTGPRAEVVGFGTHVTWLEYAMNQCSVVTQYFRLVLWPHPLVLDYGPTLPVPFAQIVAPGLVLVLLFAASVYALFRWPRVGFLGLAVFVILAPSSSVVPLVPEVGAERRMHLPLAPLTVLLVLFGRELLARWFPRDADDAPQAWAAVLATVLVSATLAVVSVRRNADYESRVSIWTTAAAAAPGNARAHYNLGVVLVDEGRLEEAQPSFERAIRLKPDYDEAYYNLGLSLAQRGRVEEAVANFARALAIDPQNAETHNNMGGALLRLGRADKAIGHFEEALRLNPEKVTARNNLGSALAALGKSPEAIVHFRRALEIDPQNGETRRNLGLALLLTGATTEGEGHLEEAARRGHDASAAWSAVAAALVRHPDPAVRDAERAIRYARRAVDLTGGRDPRALAQLADCLALTGETELAITTMEQAIARAEAAGATGMVEQLKTRLREYHR